MASADLRHLIDLLGWTLLDFCWQGLLIAAGYALLRGLLGPGRPQARLAVGYLAMTAMALIPVLTALGRWTAAAPALTGSAAASLGAAPAFDASAMLSSTGIIEAWLPALVAAWAAGVLSLAMRAGWQWQRLRRICALAQPVPVSWQIAADRLARRFGTPKARLLESARIQVPLMIGWLKPVILLPAALCTRLPSAQIELLLAHELAHIRRRDFIANLLQIVVETVLFYHPAVHWVSRRIREDRELCCDDLVSELCNAPIDYARALLSVAEQRPQTPRLAVAATGGQLRARIERIVARPAGAQARPVQEAWPGALLLMATVLAWGALAGHTLPDRLPLPPIAWERLGVPTPVLGLSFGDLRLERPRIEPRIPEPAAVAPAATASSSAVANAEVSGPRPGPAIERERPALEAAPSIPPLTIDPPAATPAAADETVRSSSVPTPRAIHVETPRYPRVARIRGIEGSVVLSYRIERGRATDIAVESGTHSEFASAAEQALRRWRFAPGADSLVRHQQPFDFRITEQAESDTCVTATGTRICRPTN